MAKPVAKKVKRSAKRVEASQESAAHAIGGKASSKSGLGLLLGLVFLAVLVGVVVEIVFISKKKVAQKIEFVHVGALVPKGQSDGQCWGGRSMAIAPSGAWYYLDGENQQWRLQKFNADMSFGGKYKPTRKDDMLVDPYALACDSKGNLYVLQTNGLIRVLDSALKPQRTIATKVANACSLDLNTKDEIYVLGSAEQLVNAYANDGHFLFSFGKPGSGKNALASPIRIAVDAKDNVYVLE